MRYSIDHCYRMRDRAEKATHAAATRSQEKAAFKRWQKWDSRIAYLGGEA